MSFYRKCSLFLKERLGVSDKIELYCGNPIIYHSDRPYRVVEALLFVPLLVLFLVWPASAQKTAFQRVHLAYDISLDVPAHWKVLSQETRQNLAAAREAASEAAGVQGSSGHKITLLAVNATPSPVGAMIRVSVTVPPDYTQAELAEATPADLKDVGVELVKQFRRLEAAGGPKIIEMQNVHLEKVNGKLAVVMPYIRGGANDSSPWQVTQYKIPVSNRLIEITLSYRQSDGTIWKPILERVKRSIKF